MSGLHRRDGHACRRLTFACAALALVATLADPKSAYAEAAPTTDEARARDAYERGSIAYGRGDYAHAAAEFAQADAALPSPVALRAALDAVVLADDPVLGGELLERAERAPMDKALAAAVSAARARFVHRTGRIAVRCAESNGCLAAIDGAAVVTSSPRRVTVGVHTVTLQIEGAVEQRLIRILPDQSVEVTPTPRLSLPPPPAERVHSASKIAPLWFFSALALTAAVGGLAIWSATDTSDRHARFLDAGCARMPAGGCTGLAADGVSAQKRTNVLAIGSGVFAAGTATLGLFTF